MGFGMLDYTGMFGRGMGGYGKGSGKFLLLNGSPIALIVVGALGLFWLWMLVDCLKRNFKKDVDKLVWIGLLVFIPVVGVFLYYFMVKAQKK